MVMAMANLAMATGNIGREGVGVNPLRGQNNVQGSCDMGSFPHEFSGYRHVSDDAVRAPSSRALWNVHLDAEPGLRIPNMFDAAIEGTFKGLFVQGEDIAQSDPNTKHVNAALEAMECVVVQDLFLNETAAFAHVFLPGTSFLEKDGTFTNAERRINRVRPVMAPKQGMQEWEMVCAPRHRHGLSDELRLRPRQSWTRSPPVTPTFAGVSFDKLDRLGSRAVAVQRQGAGRHADHACGRLRARQGPLHDHRIRADARAHQPLLPADPHHGAHPVAIQCRRPDAAHRQCAWHRGGRAGDPSA